MRKPLPKVELNKSTNIRLTYKEDVYNVNLFYSSGELTIALNEPDNCLDSMTYKINSEVCEISCNGLVHDVSVGNLPYSSLARVLYEFVSDFGGVIPTENYDNERLCSYISRKVFNSDITFEVFEKENDIAYSIHIT